MAEAATGSIALPQTTSLPVLDDLLPPRQVKPATRARRAGEPYPTPGWAMWLMLASVLVAVLGVGYVGTVAMAEASGAGGVTVNQPQTEPTGTPEDGVKTPKPIATPEPTSRPVADPTP